MSAESLRASCEKWSQLFSEVVLHPRAGLIFLTLNRATTTTAALKCVLQGCGSVPLGHGGELQHVTVWPSIIGRTGDSSSDAAEALNESMKQECHASQTEPAEPSRNLLASMDVARLLIGVAALTRVLVRVGHKAVLTSRWSDTLKNVCLCGALCLRRARLTFGECYFVGRENLSILTCNTPFSSR